MKTWRFLTYRPFLSLWAVFCLLAPPCVWPNDPPPAAGPAITELPPALIAGPRQREVITDPAGFELVSDPNTQIETVIVQCQNPDDPFLLEFLKTLRSDIEVIVVVRDVKTAEGLWKEIEEDDFERKGERLCFVSADGRPIKKWGRDPFTVLVNPKTRTYTLLNAYPHDHWIPRLILERHVGLPNLVDNDFPVIPTWFLEGGAVAADDRFAYVGNGVIYTARRKDNGEVVESRAAVIQSIENLTKKKVIVLASTDLHCDRYHIPVGRTAFGERTSLLADPMKAMEILSSLTPAERQAAMKQILHWGTYKNRQFLKTPDGMDETKWIDSFLNKEDLENFLNIRMENLQAFKTSAYVESLDQAEQELKKQGIAVIRVPALNHSYDYEEWTKKDGKMELEIKKFYFPFGLFYTNVIQDRYKGKRTVVIPEYGIKKLDDEVVRVYSSLKCFSKIDQVPAVIEGTQGGGPRCRVQILGYPDPVPTRLVK